METLGILMFVVGMLGLVVSAVWGLILLMFMSPPLQLMAAGVILMAVGVLFVNMATKWRF